MLKPLKKAEDSNVKKTVEEPKEASKPDAVSKGKKSTDTVSSCIFFRQF